MTEMQSDICVSKMHQNILKYELDFCRIYYEAIRKLLDFRDESNSRYLRRYLDYFRLFFDNWCECINPSFRDNKFIRRVIVDSLYYRILYIYFNSTVLSSAVAFQFQNLLAENSSLLKKKCIKICSLGGGSASDVVAIATVLDSMAREKGLVLDIRVTIIDMDEKWKNTSLTVLNCLEQFHKATWKISFIKADLSQPFSSNVAEDIRGADIVTMVKFLSEYISSQRNLKETFKEICSCLKPRSMLFILDYSMIRIIQACGGFFGRSNDFDLLYEDVGELHTLEDAAVKKLSDLYGNQFKEFESNTDLIIFVKALLKKSCPESTKFRNCLDYKFAEHCEKYNEKQSHLNSSRFQQWEASFLKIKREQGWSYRALKRIVLKKNQQRLQILIELRAKKRLIETLRKTLLDKNQDNLSLKEITTFNEIFSKYFFEKSMLSIVKRNAYDFRTIMYSLK